MLRDLATPEPSHFLVSRPGCDAQCSQLGDACSFQVAWSINPHMRIGAACSERARVQHAGFVTALRAAGATVVELPFVHGAFDSVFMKDSAIVAQQQSGAVHALLARPRFSQRQAEQESRTHALVAHGIRVVGASRAYLEGGDVVVLPGARGAFLGHGFRSEPEAARELEGFLLGEVACIELSDRRLYHLDMALSVLDDGTALVCEEALTKASVRALESHRAIRDIVRVPLEEVLRFGVNVVQVGRTIVMAGDAPMTERALRLRGYDVKRVVLDEFHLAGGSAACLTARVHRCRTSLMPIALDSAPYVADDALTRLVGVTGAASARPQAR